MQPTNKKTKILLLGLTLFLLLCGVFIYFYKSYTLAISGCSYSSVVNPFIINCGVSFEDDQNGTIALLGRVKRFYISNKIAYMKLNFGTNDMDFRLGKTPEGKILFVEEGVNNFESKNLGDQNLKSLNNDYINFLNKTYKYRYANVILYNEQKAKGVIPELENYINSGKLNETEKVEANYSMNYLKSCMENQKEKVINLSKSNFKMYVNNYLTSKFLPFADKCVPNVQTVTIKI